MLRFFITTYVAWLAFAAPAIAHDLRSGYLELKEESNAFYDVIWKPPTQAGLEFQVTPKLPEDCTIGVQNVQRTGKGERIESWSVRCEQRLQGRSILFENLNTTRSDILVRHVSEISGTHALRASNNAPEIVIPQSVEPASFFRTFFVLGIEHILAGIDHLLFVLCLLFIVNGLRRLIFTITAFTVAHSITLGATVIWSIDLPGRAVESIIALSIVILAAEALSINQDKRSLLLKAPWLAAFVFGLLHGFGFASALLDIGLPDSALPTTLLAFNLGVEAGQLIFVGAAIICMKMMEQILVLQKIRWVSLYATGTIATKWLIERMM